MNITGLLEVRRSAETPLRGQMTALFAKGPELKVTGVDGHFWSLLEAKEVVAEINGKLRRFLMPMGAKSDGASIPFFLWTLGLAPFGVYWPAAFFHDCAFRGTLLELNEDLAVGPKGEWVAANLDEGVANDLINALMFCLQVETAVRLAIYEALKLFGRKAFLEDRLALRKANGLL